MRLDALGGSRSDWRSGVARRTQQVAVGALWAAAVVAGGIVAFIAGWLAVRVVVALVEGQ